MANLFQKMYIGDPNKRKDLTKKAVKEQSRFSLFFTVIKVRGLNLVWLDLLYVLFLIPTLFVIYLALYQYALSVAGEQDPMTFQDVVSYIYVLFPCMLIACPGTLGFTNVLHRWANDEHAWISDFWTGIKKNWKQGLIVTVINYISLVFLIYCIWFWLELSKNTSENVYINFFFGAGKYIAFFLIGCVFVYFAIHMYVYPMLVRYKLKLKEIYKYSAILAFRNLFGTVALIFFVIFCIWGALYIPLQYMILLSALLLSFVYLVIYVHMGWVFNRNVFLDTKEY